MGTTIMTGETSSSTSRTSCYRYYRYNHILFSIYSLLLLLLGLLSSPDFTEFASAAKETEESSVPACTVTINDEDVTDEFFVVDESNNDENENENNKYVDCMGHSKCRDAIITNCPRIKCYDSEACNSAVIINFTESVLCEGLHACHRTNMTLAAPAAPEAAKKANDKAKTKVSCIGSGACDVALILGEIDEFVFSGVKAGRKVHVEDAKLVKCHDGHETNVACESLATFLNVQCLYCGKNGCADHINTCRYKLFAPGADENAAYEKCQPKSVLGENCPTGLEKELRMELSGKEEIDGGGKKKKRGIRG